MLLAGGDEPSEALSGLQRITIVAALPFVLVMLLLCFALVKDLRRDPLSLRRRLATTVVERAIRTGVDQHGGVQFDLVTKHECGERCSDDARPAAASRADSHPSSPQRTRSRHMTTVLEGRPAGNATAEAGAVPGVRSTGTAQYVLTLACPERPGIVRAVTAFLADRGFDIVEHQQFDDHISGKLYLRTAFTPASHRPRKARPARKASARSSPPSPTSSAWISPSTTAARSGCW